MFPRPLGTHRGNPGAFSLVSLDPIKESYTGSAIASQTIFYSSTDVADELEWEYFDGSTWIPVAGDAAVEAYPYAPGRKYRIRLVNDYFESASAYTEAALSTEDITGGAVAFQATMPSIGPISSVSISSSFPGSRTVSFTLSHNTAFYVSSPSLPTAQCLISINWTELDSPGGSVTGTFNRNTTINWPGSTSFSTNILLTDYLGSIDFIAVTFSITYVDSTADPATIPQQTVNWP